MASSSPFVFSICCAISALGIHAADHAVSHPAQRELQGAPYDTMVDISAAGSLAQTRIIRHERWPDGAIRSSAVGSDGLMEDAPSSELLHEGQLDRTPRTTLQHVESHFAYQRAEDSSSQNQISTLKDKTTSLQQQQLGLQHHRAQETSTATQPEALSFKGYCRYDGYFSSSEMIPPRIENQTEKSGCQRMCKSTEGCTAYAWDPITNPHTCDLYGSGPYTSGSGNGGATCYILQDATVAAAAGASTAPSTNTSDNTTAPAMNSSDNTTVPEMPKRAVDAGNDAPVAQEMPTKTVDAEKKAEEALKKAEEAAKKAEEEADKAEGEATRAEDAKKLQDAKAAKTKAEAMKSTAEARKRAAEARTSQATHATNDEKKYAPPQSQGAVSIGPGAYNGAAQPAAGPGPTSRATYGAIPTATGPRPASPVADAQPAAGDGPAMHATYGAAPPATAAAPTGPGSYSGAPPAIGSNGAAPADTGGSWTVSGTVKAEVRPIPPAPQ